MTHPMAAFINLREIESDMLCLAQPGQKGRDYQAVIQVGSVGFALLSEGEQEEILEGFRVLLTRITFRVTIHIKIEPYNLAPYLTQIDETARRNRHMTDIIADHRNFIRFLATQRALLQRNFYVLISADEATAKGKHTEAFESAKHQLHQRCTDIIHDLERMGLSANRLTTRELATYYFSGLHATCAQKYPLQEAALESLQSTRVAELVQPNTIEVRRTFVRVRNREDEYLRGFAVVGYPRQVVSGWLDRLISIDEPFIELCLHIHPLDSSAYVQKLSRKLVAFVGTQKVNRNRGRQADPHIAAAQHDIELLRDKLVRQEEQVFRVSLYILVRASTKTQLEERTNRVYSQLRSLDLKAIALTMRHDKAFLCFLPGRDILKKSRILDTSSIVTAFPFSDNSLVTMTGSLRGIAPNGSLIILDEFSEALENANECTFAKSGAGKSYTSKIRILRSLAAGVRVCVIAPENEYDRLARRVQGEVITLTSGSLQVNPFDLALSTGEAEDIVKEKCQSLLTLFDLLLADRSGSLTQKEKAYLSQCIFYCYDYFETRAPHILPCMSHLYSIIRAGTCGPDVFGLAERLQRFVSLFPDRTTIDFKNHLLVFNIRDLGDDIRGAGLFLITEFVWSQMRRSRRPKPRLLLIDEAWSLLQFEAGGRFLANIARRARKYYLGLSIITHDVRDCVNSEWGRAIMTNASLTFLMKQDPSSIDAVADVFHLSPSEKRYLLGCGKGEGLYIVKGRHIPMKVEASPLEHRLATTNPKEVILIEQEEALSHMRHI